MSLHAHPVEPIPELTIRMAKASFPKGTLAMRLRDELGPIYHDLDFAALFPKRGRGLKLRGVSRWSRYCKPWKIFRIDRRLRWSVVVWIGNMRSRSHSMIPVLTPASCLTFGNVCSTSRHKTFFWSPSYRYADTVAWLKAGGTQRVDSTMVLAQARQLSSLEGVGETIRALLNDVADLEPEWVLSVITPEWFDRYVHRFEFQRFPKGKQAQEALRQQVGEDGWHLLQAASSPNVPKAVSESLYVKLLHQIWGQYYEHKDGHIRWRDGPPLVRNEVRVASPYETEARESCKRGTEWFGYKVHLTETCGQEDAVNLIVNVTTTEATTQDVEALLPITHQLREDKQAPEMMLADMGYTYGEGLVHYAQHGGRLVGPIQAEHSWQQALGYGLEAFELDWDNQQARCPQGHLSQRWGTAGRNHKGEQRIEITFATKTCQACPMRTLCTKQAQRVLRPLPREQYEAVLARRREQRSRSFQQDYAQRAGVESTMSQGVRCHGMRRSRYRGIKKTHLQMTAIAAAMNLMRIDTMLEQMHAGLPPRRPRPLSPLARLQALSSA